MWCFSYMIDNDFSNIVKYIDTVGYRYNRKNHRGGFYSRALVSAHLSSGFVLFAGRSDSGY